MKDRSQAADQNDRISWWTSVGEIAQSKEVPMFRWLVLLLVLAIVASSLAPTRHWLQRHGWWALLAIAVISVASGLFDLASGVTWQAPDLTGKTIAQIAAESADGSRLSDFGVRTGGLYLIAFGVLLGAILLFGFRQDHRWAWWAMWTFPAMAITASFVDLASGVAGPAITGGIVGILAAAILLISAPRFFKQPGDSHGSPRSRVNAT